MHAIILLLTIAAAPPSAAPLLTDTLKPDTLFANQLGFIGRDSILTFLTANWGGQTDNGCAVYYRIAPVNRYFQYDGRVVDYYMNNDSIAASFSYDHGNLEGPAYTYYHNGIIKERGTYRNNIRYGTWEYFYDNGQKDRTLQYDNGQPTLLDSYTRNGDVLAKNGNGRFEGWIAPGITSNYYEMLAKGKIKNGVPDGEWTLAVRDFLKPAKTEYFSTGRFRHGIAYAHSGRTSYTGGFYSNFERMHPWENIDHYLYVPTCLPNNNTYYQSNGYREVRRVVNGILATNKYPDWTGWIVLDNPSVRLSRPNAGLENDLRAQIRLLPYGVLYIIVIENNQVTIPEETLQKLRIPG